MRRLGPAGVPRPPRGPRPPTPQSMPALTWAPVTPQTGRPAPETHGRATRAGAGERLEAPGRSGPGRAGGGVPPPRPRRGAPPPPPGRAPPRPRHLEPCFRSAAGTGASEPQLPVSSPPRGPSAAPSTSGAGPPPPVPARLSRLQLWAFAGLAESSRRDRRRPGPRRVVAWSAPPRPSPPAPSRPIRRRVPSHALIRPAPSPGPQPLLGFAGPEPPHAWPQLTVRSHSGFSECLPPQRCSCPAHACGSLDSHVPEHTALLSRLSALC